MCITRVVTVKTRDVIVITRVVTVITQDVTFIVCVVIVKKDDVIVITRSVTVITRDVPDKYAEIDPKRAFERIREGEIKLKTGTRTSVFHAGKVEKGLTRDN
jgi:hypothetical protein